MDKIALERSIARIMKMEQCFDLVTDSLQNTPDALQSPSVQEAVQALSDYFENGYWIQDYELDEQRVLPIDLKRGVLSQDGLYDLLSEVKEKNAR